MKGRDKSHPVMSICSVVVFFFFKIGPSLMEDTEKLIRLIKIYKHQRATCGGYMGSGLGEDGRHGDAAVPKVYRGLL